MTDYDFLFKILVLGDSNVGKSSLLRRFVDDEFQEQYSSTIGIDFKIKTLVVDRLCIKLQIWDTAGQERFRSLSTSYFRGANGIFIVTDITNLESFNNCASIWIPLVKCHAEDDPPAIILVNKCDLKKQSIVDDAYLNRLIYPYFKTSAKEAINILEPFECIIRKMIESRRLAYEPKIKVGTGQIVHIHQHTTTNTTTPQSSSGCKC